MSDYVYNYGVGDKVWTLNEDDSLSIDSDTATHIIGIQTYGEATKIVFDDYSSLNIWGRPGEVVVNGETIVEYDPIDYALDSLDVDNEIYTTQNATIDLNQFGLSGDRVRGIRQVDEFRTLVAYDNYQALNIYGRPAEVVLDGNTVIKNDPIYVESDEVVATNDILWGTSDTNVFSYKYGDGSDIVIGAESDDVIDLSSVKMSDIRGIKLEDEKLQFVFNNYEALNVFGRPGTVCIENDVYSVNYDNHTMTKVSTSEE